MYIEGKNAVKQAVESGQTINKIFVSQNEKRRGNTLLDLIFSHKIKVEFLPKNLMDNKSKTGHHQGYIAEAVDFDYCEISDILQVAQERGEKPFIILLDGIEDPHNFGAIIRSCECAGVHGIVIPKNRACMVNETVIRTSTGAIANMKIAKVTNLKDAIKHLQENDIWVFSAEAGGKSVYAQNLNIPLALVIGSEGFGVKKTIQSACDGVLALPLCGKVNSLNASVACGILVFEVVRQRLK